MNLDKSDNNKSQHAPGRLWHPFTRFSAFRHGPLPDIVRGGGIYLYDSGGRPYIDAISSWWCAALGHSHPKLVEAVKKQAEVLGHTITGNLTNPWTARLAQRLAEKMPHPQRHVIFASDGASAVEAALKCSVQYHHNMGNPEKNRFLGLKYGYHGDTLGAVGVGFVPEFHKPFERLIVKSLVVDLPDYGPRGSGFAPAEEIIDANSRELAAVIVEPLVQGAAGMRFYDACFLRDLSKCCAKNDILLIVDEIAMGFGRTGRYWAFEHAGIDPDIVCAGKALTGGMLPLSAAICKDFIYETFSDLDGPDKTFYHGHTFGGNPMGAACALSAMEVYDEIDAPERALRLDPIMMARLKELQGLSGVKDVRGLGLIGVVELQAANDGGEREERARAVFRQKGVLLRPLGDVFYLFPPLVITEEELDKLCKIFVDTLKEII